MIPFVFDFKTCKYVNDLFQIDLSLPVYIEQDKTGHALCFHGASEVCLHLSHCTKRSPLLLLACRAEREDIASFFLLPISSVPTVSVSKSSWNRKSR
ncbi:hypothetical protein DPMN_105337 [Dreissena polymorpha]|uniref:Uncharacterized protein n=1 Tax=Dreissena polymorpha TaxID=45954 RepID=A0A9D4HEK0_DREPO|nr:hypothetical protein DPMN_105337 [Dreissena polymorpha]